MIPYPPERERPWILRSRAVHLPDGTRPADIRIVGELIDAIVPHGTSATIDLVVDVGEKLILPGLVETHAHVNEPGRTEWEGFASATRAAAAGGITTLIDMPLNSSPVTTTVEALASKQKAADGQIRVDVGFHAGVIPGNADQVPALLQAGVCGFKAFLCHSGIDEFPNATESDLRAVMPLLAAAGVPLLAHAEWVSPIEPALTDRFARQPDSYAAYLATRPVDWEIDAIRLLLDLCREYRCPVHIVHLAAAAEARPLLARAKADGLPVTVETCPHYLMFSAEEIPDGDPRFKCAPPIREARQRDTLREMVRTGEIDTLGSDHSPAPESLKKLAEGNLREAWGGIASLQLLLSACWTAVEEPRSVIDALTRRPAALAGLTGRKGSIHPGADADFAIFDPDAEWVVDAKSLHHRHAISPYAGRRLRGKVIATFLRGQLIFDEGTFPTASTGRLIRRGV